MGGIILPALPSSVIFGVGQVRAFATQLAISRNPGTATPYRPRQWSKPPLNMITIPAAYVQTPSSASSNSSITGGGNPTAASSAEGAQAAFVMSVSVNTVTQPPNTAPSYLIFDGVIRSRPSQRATPTRLPIQTQANITDHVLLNPPSLTMEVFMTDVLPARVAGQWVGDPSKSVSCFKVLSALRAARVPLTITTRLATYVNMIIADIIPDESRKTRYAFHAQVEFEGINVASVATQAYSARPQTTGTTALGTTQVTAPAAGVVSQNELPSTSTGAPSAAALQKVVGTVQGAGNWSSNNTSGISKYVNAPDLF